MCKRATAVYCVIMLMMVTAIFRIYSINVTDYITMAASVQGEYGLDIASTRGNIYDRDFARLVNTEYNYIASVLPTPQSAAALLEVATEEERPALMERLSSTRPFAMRVENNNIYADGVDIFRIPQRYSQLQIAPHLVGYLSGDSQHGVAGIEKAYDSWLQETGGTVSVLYQMDAVGRAMRNHTIGVQRNNEDGAGGVVLTLDADFQQLAQNALAAGCQKGAAVVIEVDTGNILAMASLPVFDQNNIAASLNSQDAPFINRAISGFNIGSVFKMVVSAAALENNVSRYKTYNCLGYIDVDGQIFRCNNNRVHGEVDMQRALEVSCNTYFINTVLDLGPDYVLALCKHLGLGSVTELAPELFTQPGNLPTATELKNPAALANFGFGQGSSLATPLQMAQVVATIANGGASVTPRLVQGLTQDGSQYTWQSPTYTPNQILSTKTAKVLKDLMIAVIEEGSGKPAKPVAGGAGGKTSSAQTGQMVETQDGEKEIVHAWFAGFFPAETPKYSVVIFVEGGESGEQVAAPIFKQIADGIAGLES